jgi:acetyl esterase/lipase
VNRNDQLDPAIAPVVAQMGFGDLDAEVLPTMRFPMGAPAVDGVERSEHVVAGSPDVLLRVHRPAGTADPVGCVYAIHGGGYVIGDYTMEDQLFNELCPALGLVGVSVEYRLAPETTYPHPLEDCYRGLHWTREHASDLGIDPARIGLYGLSAGGGLAAALALLARDRGEVPLAFQVLDSPMLDDRQVTPSSQRDDLLVWTRRSNEFGWRSYLGDLYGRDDIPYTAAAARAEDLTWLPPAFVSVGGLDGFCDETIDYARRLNAAGVATELHVYPGAPHGFAQMAPDAAVCVQAKRDRNEWLSRQLRH